MKKNLIFIIVITTLLLILSACDAGKKDMKTVEQALNSETSISEFIDSEIKIERISKSKIQGLTTSKYRLIANVNETFENLSNEEKYKFFSDLESLASSAVPGISSYGCGNGEFCSLKEYQLLYKDDVYEKRRIGLNDTDSLLLNEVEIYQFQPVNKTSTTTSVDESETRTTGKTGGDWNSLNDNEKFHAVSNALYNLDQAGYTITEGEYEFIDALDVFYSDEQNSSVEVSKALVQMGLLSGAIFK